MYIVLFGSVHLRKALLRRPKKKRNGRVAKVNTCTHRKAWQPETRTHKIVKVAIFYDSCMPYNRFHNSLGLILRRTSFVEDAKISERAMQFEWCACGIWVARRCAKAIEQAG